MAFWRNKKQNSPTLQQWDLPGVAGTVSLPTSLAVNMEDDGTLLAELDDLLSLRFSSISFTKEGADVETLAKVAVKDRAAEENNPYFELDDKGISTYDQPGEQDDEPLLIKFWHVGAKCTLLIISATFPTKYLKNQKVQDFLNSMQSILESVAIVKTHEVLNYEGEEVSLTRQIVDSQESIDPIPFGPDEEAWLEESREQAAELGVKYGSGGTLTPDELDVVFSRWMLDEEEKEAAELVANSLGAAFGDYMIENHGFSWVVVDDEYGTEYAVQHPIGQTMSFPIDSVFKRIESNETEFFKDLRLGILAHMQQMNEDQ